MFEHYSPDLLSKEKIVEDWALLKKISRARKIGIWRIGVEQDRKERDAAGYEALSRKRISFYLATFLIGAQEYSYFQYGWGWELKTGPLCGYPEFTKPLGNPAGDTIRVDPKGWQFTRDFEHARVSVDLEKREGTIEWK